MDTCPCGSDKTYADCCEPVIQGEREASTAEELMRSRYSAYALGEIDWIMASHHPDTVESVDRHTTEHWSNDSDWLGLTINDTEGGGPDDDDGAVNFRARYRQHGQVINHNEMAYFARDDGAWRFHSVLADPEEEQPDLVPVTAAAPAGRNDPCPCGSGKKYKKCHGAA